MDQLANVDACTYSLCILPKICKSTQGDDDAKAYLQQQQQQQATRLVRTVGRKAAHSRYLTCPPLLCLGLRFVCLKVGG